MTHFDDKVVLLTGATGGLGRELARQLSAEGARLLLTGRSLDALAEVRDGLPHPDRALLMDGRLTEPGEAARLARSAEAVHGRVDVLVNNAGMGYFALVEEASDERIRELFEVNTFAPLTFMRLLVPGMKERGEGLVVNVASAAGRVPIPTVGIYGASKSALALLSGTMRFELEPSGVRIVNVYPGTVDTAFEANALRESHRGGLYGSGGYRGSPASLVAGEILKAARGDEPEVWLDREGRRMSIEALRRPARVQRKLRPLRDRALRYGESGKPHAERRWRLWQLETSLRCNLRCRMCPWPDRREEVGEGGLMSDAVWAALRKHLPEVASVDFSGAGEPLLHPGLLPRIREARAAGCTAGFLTNGTLLDERVRREVLLAGTDWIAVSLDGASKETYERIRVGASFEEVTANLRRLSTDRGKGPPRTAVNFVLMRETFAEAEDIVRLAADLGVDQVNFKHCDFVRGRHGRDLEVFAPGGAEVAEDAERALRAARKRAARLGVATAAPSFSPDEQPVCEQDPRDSLFVRWDGTAAPCINLAYPGPTTFLGTPAEMPAVHYGALPGTSLPELWEGASCARIRRVFASRVSAWETRIVTGGLGHSIDEMERAFERARAAMPDAPEGCRCCHYLYGL